VNLNDIFISFLIFNQFDNPEQKKEEEEEEEDTNSSA
jgi:hypothetical protein